MKRSLVLLGILFFGTLSAQASDNVLQAVQVNGVEDTYNIILKADDQVDVKKTVQAPNKIILDMKGIRPSKSINTIYNNTTSVDTVVVEPVGDDALKVFIQADNVDKATVSFDALKAPLALEDTAKAPSAASQKDANSIVLAPPMRAYTPLYEGDRDSVDFTMNDIIPTSLITLVRQIRSNERLSSMVSFGLISIILLAGIRIFKKKDDEIQVGLTSRDLRANKSQNLQQPIMDEYEEEPQQGGYLTPESAPLGQNYGLKAYQNSTKNPYMTTDIPARRPVAQPSQPQMRPQMQQTIAPQQNLNLSKLAQQMQTTSVPQSLQRPQRAPQVATMQTQNLAQAPRKVNNIDSMKFLESMTKIYEKSGRTDLAQGLKNNIDKVRTRV